MVSLTHTPTSTATPSGMTPKGASMPSPFTLSGLAEKYLRHRPDGTLLTVTVVEDGVPLVGTYKKRVGGAYIFLGGIQVFASTSPDRGALLVYPDEIVKDWRAEGMIFAITEPTR